MKQQKDNYFKTKFGLLNSQEDSEEIIWSCSDSSEYENSFNEINVKAMKRKRKRVKSKKNISNNISNLDITFVGETLKKNNKNKIEDSHSSDHACIENVSKISKVDSTSPILSFQRYLAKKSTVISPGSSICIENEQISPVLEIKHNTPKFSPKVRRKVFDNNRSPNRDLCRRDRSLSPVLCCTDIRLRKSSKHQNRTKNDNSFSNRDDRRRVRINKCDSSTSKSRQIYDNINNETEEQIHTNNVNLDDIFTEKTPNVVLVGKVRSYFDSYFSSTTNSQHSISECESKSSPKSNDDNDIEIINSLPEIRDNLGLKSDNIPLDSLESLDNISRTKKVKYKKYGLAYRLSELIKKQNANTSLWYHERFLAENSNFVLPQEQFMALRIREVNFKYGCFLLTTLDVNEDNCVVFINKLYVKYNIIEQNCILKLYKPYNIIELKGYKLIINVCKYECVMLKN